jgi:hypothetical protein
MKFTQIVNDETDLTEDIINESEIIEVLEGFLEVQSQGISNGVFNITINGKPYSYKPSSASHLDMSEMVKKFNGIFKHSQGKALSWLKKNSVMVPRGRAK